MAYRDDSYYIDRVLKHSDAAAFAGLVNKHKTMVYNIALRITKSREDSEEVAQDAFIKVFQALSQFKGDSKFTTWLFRITYNIALSKLRKKSLVSGSVDDDNFIEQADESAFDAVSKLRSNEQKKYISEALTELNDTDQLLITLYYMGDHSVDEIAEITDISATNVKVRLFRSRKKLHEILQKNLKEDLHSII